MMHSSGNPTTHPGVEPDPAHDDHTEVTGLPEQAPLPIREQNEAVRYTPPSGRSALNVSGVRSGGDTIVGGRDVTVHNTRYEQVAALLRSRGVGQGEILSDERFVPVGGPEGSAGVCVLIGPPNTGRRTSALRLLRSLPGCSSIRVFPQPDWDEPDMGRVPNAPGHGYLLDLTGMGEALPDHFVDDLAHHAESARDHGSLLVVLGDEGVGCRLPRSGERPGITVWEHQSPDALAVARKWIESSGLRERAAWLDAENSVFHGLVSSDAPPARGVELAEAVLRAEHDRDKEVLKGFADWQNQIQDWFAADVREAGAKGAEKRTLRIAAAFLDGSPAPAVLNAADELLPQVVRSQFEEWGGALAAPDDRVRCREAEVSFRDGRIHVTDSGEGLDLAVIRYLWDRRGSAAEQLSTWLSEISAPKGPASGCLDRLSEVLTEVAVARGSGTVLALLERWLKDDAHQRMDFVVKVLQSLSENPVLGARVRVVDLRNWAKGTKNPERQRAVVEVCRGGFAENYPEQALMRLRYVVQNTEDGHLHQAALSAIAEHLSPGRNRLTALRTLVDWVEEERTALVGGRLFLDLFGGSEAESTGEDPARGLLSMTGAQGDEAVDLFRRAWARTWNHPGLRTGTSHALVTWRCAADAGGLPFDRARHVLSVALGSTGIDQDLDRIIRAEGDMGYVLFKDFCQLVQTAPNVENPVVP